jgi:ERCC4-type nuclease
VREASVAELAAVPKVTPKMAQRIYDHFHVEGTPVEHGGHTAQDPQTPSSAAASAEPATGGES